MHPMILNEISRFPLFFEDETTQSFAPALDVYEHPDYYEFRFDVPGVARTDLKVGLENGVLSVEGERKSHALPETVTGRCERWAGKFARSLQLPENADYSSIEAKLADGVLSLIVKKAEAAKPRQIVIT